MELNAETIFKLKTLGKLKEGEKYLTAMLTSNYNGLLVGTPLVTREISIKAASKKSSGYYSEGVPCLNVLSSQRGSGSNHMMMLNTSQFKIMGESFVNNHKVKDVDAFDLNKLGDIQKYVEENDEILL